MSDKMMEAFAKMLKETMSPMPNHCIDCDKVATVTLNETPYCAECGLKAQQDKGDVNGSNEREIN